jgi:putative transposase
MAISSRSGNDRYRPVSGETMNSGMPPRSRNQRLPAACDAPTATAASSLVSPLAISRQNNRSTSRRSKGAPGDFIADLPVSAFIHPAGLPIGTSTLEVLRRPVESAQFRSRKYVQALHSHGLTGSMGRVGACADNAAMESFFALLQRNVLDRQRWATRHELRLAIITWIERTYHRRRRQRRLGRLTPIQYETLNQLAHAA